MLKSMRSTQRLPYPYTQCKRARDLTAWSVSEIQTEDMGVADVYLDVLLHEAAEWTPKGGDPATGSPTATLLRLHPSRRSRRRRSPP